MENQEKKRLSLYDKLMEEIEASKTNYDLFRVLRVISNEYQCCNFLVCEIPKENGFQLQEILIVSNWDPELIREYDLNHSEQIAGLFNTLRNTINPAKLNLPVNLSQLTDEIVPDGSENDCTECIFFPVYDRIGRKGMIGYSTCGPENPDRLVKLGFLSNFVFDKFMEVKKISSVQNNSLSEREIQCLNWTAHGKTSYEIGIILDISLNTVNHYLNNASRKLNCVNKTHAVAKCVQDGII